ncbi:MAG: L-histidine N(alpha)-methyltransferase [Gammaproteobacteria bacterium]|nr:L-histidine N(alpha)-methyltransferase [Gammaproteobacteria bacterium]
MSQPALKPIILIDYHPPSGDIRQEVLEGLALPQKRLSPKWFYDEEGSRLFDQITRLPEYYPTRTELGILHTHIGEMAELIGSRAAIVEFGAGSSVKIRILLDNLNEPAAFIPVDISGEHLLDAARQLAMDYPNLEILPVCADFTQAFDLPVPAETANRNLVFFPGSTIGNFSLEQARQLLKVMAIEAGAGGGLLIGVDLKKDSATLESAYNDAAGVTAEFNLNLLARLNRELDADFDLNSFAHRAVYNEDKGRIEMHLVSEKNQSVNIAGQQIDFAAGEHILTECSHKYELQEFAELAAEAGFTMRKVWTDPEKMFSVQYLELA